MFGKPRLKAKERQQMKRESGLLLAVRIIDR